VPSWIDRAIQDFDSALRAATARPLAARAVPQARGDSNLTDSQRRHAAGLMRVNHVGEVCAQALYLAQARATSDESLRNAFDAAAREEVDHLDWTTARLAELGSNPSLLNPLWFAGAFAVGWLAGKAGDRTSLGFVVETERQVEQHLAGHLDRLPASDHASRAIVEQMRDDEMRHGLAAERMGARPLPAPVRSVMRAAAKVMTATAYWL